MEVKKIILYSIALAVCLFTWNNSTAKWIFTKFYSIVVLLKCDFAIFF